MGLVASMVAAQADCRVLCYGGNPERRRCPYVLVRPRIVPHYKRGLQLSRWPEVWAALERNKIGYHRRFGILSADLYI